MKDAKEARATLLKALASASWLIEQDPDLKHADTLDHIEADVHAAKTAVEFLFDDRDGPESGDRKP